MTIEESNLYIIAEIANAAQGEVSKYYELIEAAAEAKADAVKFQFYKYDELSIPSYNKYSVFKQTFFSETDRINFVAHAVEKGLDVFIDIFDRWGLSIAQKENERISGYKIPPAIIMDQELEPIF